MFNNTAAWIWASDGQDHPNRFVCFRRVLDVEGAVSEAKVLLTADSRYEVFVNGEWLGHGPPRSWPSLWPVDPYDLRALLRPGRNVVAVLVQHIGTGTFQYLAEEPGLLAQIDWTDAAGAHSVVTDHTWRAADHPAYAWPVTRISCQQAWEEQFDARRQPPGRGDWRDPDFDDAQWPMARVMRLAGQPPHERFELRDIPMLTRQIVEPVRVRAIEAVRPADYTLSFNVRSYVNPTDLTANFIVARMLVATFIYSDTAQNIQLHCPHGQRDCRWKLNGREPAFDDRTLQHTDSGVAHARLKAGWNVLMARMTSHAHSYYPAINIWAEKPLRFAARPDGADAPTVWLAIGPFETPPLNPRAWNQHEPLVKALQIDPRATHSLFEEIWNRGELHGEEFDLPFVRPLTPDMVHAANIFAQCASERIVRGAGVAVDDPAALMTESSQWTSIQPVEGADVRLLLDFGREVIGFHEFEIDAPEGTIVDDHNFEMIQHDGRHNLAEGMNNSFRYVCREGVQRYRTFVRRGFRYSWISLRNFNRPVRIRFIRLVMSTYPMTGQGDFACSDALLTAAWHVGVHSVRCCAEDTYTDCPTYEQTHWVGDARNEAMVDLVASGDPRLSAHCWIQAGRSLDRSPITESQVPSGWQIILPAWSFLWMRWAYGHYMLTGDRAFADQAMDFLARNVDGIRRHLDEKGLFEIEGWSLFDWAPMDTPGVGIVTHQNCLAVLGLREAAELAELVGRKSQARAWRKLASDMSAAINRHLWDEKNRAYIDCIHADGTRSKVLSQQTNTAAYIAGVAQGARAARCRQIIQKAPKGFVAAGSPFFMFFVLEALVGEGRWAELVRTIRDYWGIQIEAGATTFWEMYYPNEERKTRSHCHGWSAAPTFFLSQYVLGIRPLEPGYAKLLIAPNPGGLKWAHGRVPTPHGAVECDWRSGKDGFELIATWPRKLEARIELPAGGKLTIKEGKAKKARGPRGTTCLLARGGKLVCGVK